MSQKETDEELFARMQEAERVRQRRALLSGAVVALVVVGGFALSFMFSDEMFRPELDVDAGEQNVIGDTNDPQCRGFIADITAIGADYTAMEPRLTQLNGDDVAAIDALVGELEELKKRLAAAREVSGEANLRFDGSAAELRDWFRYVDNELTLLQRVGSDRKTELGAVAPDAGTVVESGQPEKSKKSMPERLSGATLAASESFQKFRVWHTGGLHPCGPADEGETPWAPETK